MPEFCRLRKDQYYDVRENIWNDAEAYKTSPKKRKSSQWKGAIILWQNPMSRNRYIPMFESLLNSALTDQGGGCLQDFARRFGSLLPMLSYKIHICMPKQRLQMQSVSLSLKSPCLEATSYTGREQTNVSMWKGERPPRHWRFALRALKDVFAL